LLNVLLQIANKLGLSNKNKNVDTVMTESQAAGFYEEAISYGEAIIA
jgi:hypothetical protein